MGFQAYTVYGNQNLHIFKIMHLASEAHRKKLSCFSSCSAQSLDLRKEPERALLLEDCVAVKFTRAAAVISTWHKIIVQVLHKYRPSPGNYYLAVPNKLATLCKTLVCYHFQYCGDILWNTLEFAHQLQHRSENCSRLIGVNWCFYGDLT